jgi:hypothetical protein
LFKNEVKKIHSDVNTKVVEKCVEKSVVDENKSKQRMNRKKKTRQES